MNSYLFYDTSTLEIYTHNISQAIITISGDVSFNHLTISGYLSVNNNISTINVNESIFVSKGWKHRLSNHSNENLIIVEVQIGDYLGEDDIIRFEDLYGRN